MSKFNSTVKPKKIFNHEGSLNYKLNPINHFFAIIMSSMMKSNFYQSDIQKSVDDIIEKVNDEEDLKLLARMILFSRNTIGLRSITHYSAYKLASKISGYTWSKDFFEKVIFRVDDMLEISSLFYKKSKKHLPNAVKKGFKKAFNKFNDYQIAKYKKTNHNFSLIDLVNLVHPIPNKDNETSLMLLVQNQLSQKDTWESELTKIGQNFYGKQSEIEKMKVWKRLLEERKLGYLAIIRNIRNILSFQNKKLTSLLSQNIKDDKLIKKSKIFPFQLMQAFDLEKLPLNIQFSLDYALNKSIENVPNLDGKTLVVIDVSASMGSGLKSYKGNALILANILAKKNDNDLMIFGSKSSYIPFSPIDSIKTNFNIMMEYNYRSEKFNVGHGTKISSIFSEINKSYERIIILSDMQVFENNNYVENLLKNYKKRFNSNPYIYSIDMAGYGTSVFKENKTILLSGFSDKIFTLIENVENGKDVLNKIKSIEL